MNCFWITFLRLFSNKAGSVRIAASFILILLLNICIASNVYSFSIRILILDDSYKSVPKLNDMKRVGNINGKLLFKGIEYDGKIEVFRGEEGLFVVNELPIEDYVKGVVKVEVGENWPLEALKAQAVAVRTYAIYNMHNKNNTIYHVTSSSLSQLYKGLQTDSDVEKAVNSTSGEILTYNGEVINALYHSTSGGLTELPEEVFGSSFPYLKSVTCDSSTSPFYIWERRIHRQELENILKFNPIIGIEVVSKTKTGRAKEVKLTGIGAEKVFQANELRQMLGWKRLPSTWFTTEVRDKMIIFRGKGYGHGVGMCQWSSMEMAKKGINYKEILATFYQGTVIKLYEDR